MTSLWLNVVSDTPNDPAIPKSKRKFWAGESGSEQAMIEDAAEYPRPGQCGGHVYYVETHRIELGSGTDLSDAAQRFLRAQERERESVRVMRASHVREVVGGLA